MGQLKQRKTAVGLAVAAILASMSATGQPIGTHVIHGGATLSQQGSHLTVTTANGPGSNHSAIDWQSFSVPAGSVTRFIQPSTTSLSINRVVGGTQSLIDGTLSSNGKLVLVNPAGIAFGVGSVVDTAGFTASTLSMSDQDALSGVLRFSNGGSAQGITGEGRILAREGDVFLIAPTVQVKEGAVIQASSGVTVLAAGQTVQITGRGLEGIVMEVQAPSDEAVNLGKLEAGAVGIFAGTLRHSGEIRAVAASSEGGRVVLKAVGDATVDGTVMATQGTRGGQIDVFGTRVAVQGAAVLDASGEQGGGTIRVGGDYQGGNPDVPNATFTFFGSQARIAADALDNGDGGRIILWADGSTRSYGHISVRGGEQGGNGGFVEVSGKQALDMTSQVDASAPQGMRGTLLIDPKNLQIATGSSSIELADASTLSEPLNDAYLSPAILNAATANVILRAAQSINFMEAVDIAAPNVGLTAEAPAISVYAPITTNNGPIELIGTAAVIGSSVMLSSVTINAGTSTFTATGPSGVTINSSLISAGGGISVIATNVGAPDNMINVNDSRLEAGGGNITITHQSGAGRVWFANSIASTTGGNITLTGNNTISTLIVGGVELMASTLDAGTGSILIDGRTASTQMAGVAVRGEGTGLKLAATGPGGVMIAGQSAGSGVSAAGVDLLIVGAINPVTSNESYNLTLSGSTLYLYDYQAKSIAAGSQGRVQLRPRTDIRIAVGGSTTLLKTYAVPNTYSITQSLLDRVSAGTIVIGGTNLNAGLNIQGTVSLSSDRGLSLLQGDNGLITQAADAAITVGNLRIAGGTVQLTADNHVNVLSGRAAGDFEFWNTGLGANGSALNLDIGTVDGVSGLTAGNVTLKLGVDAGLTQDAPIITGTLSLPQAGWVALGLGGNQFSRVIVGELAGGADITNTSTAGSTLELRRDVFPGDLAYRALRDVTIYTVAASVSASTITFSSALGNVDLDGAPLTAASITLETPQGRVNSAGLLTTNALSVTAGTGIDLTHTVSSGVASITTLSSTQGDVLLTSNSDLALQAGASAPAGQLAIQTSKSLEINGNLNAGNSVDIEASAVSFPLNANQAITAETVSITAGTVGVGLATNASIPTLTVTANSTNLQSHVNVGSGATLSFASSQQTTSSHSVTLAGLTLNGSRLQGTGDIEITGNLTAPAGSGQNSITGPADGSQLTIKGGDSTLSRTTFISGYQVNQNGMLSVDSALNVAGYLENTGTIDLLSSPLSVTLMIVETLHNAAGASLNLSDYLQIEKAMTNDGTVTVSGANGSLQLYGSPNPAVSDAVLTNNGQITLTGALGLNPMDTQGGIVHNRGTVRRTGDAGTSLIDVERFNNDGTLQIDQGTLLMRYYIANPGVDEIVPVFAHNAGDIVLAAGATLATGGNDLTHAGRISGTGTLDLGAGTLTNAGTISPGGDGVIGAQPLTLNAAQVDNTSSALLKFDISGDLFDQLAITGGSAWYASGARVAINLLTTRDVPATYTLQTGGSGGTLPTGLSGVSPGSSLRFGSLILDLGPGGPVLVSAPTPIPAAPPTATPLPLIPPYLDALDNPLSHDTPAFTDDDGGGTESLLIDNGLVCLP